MGIIIKHATSELRNNKLICQGTNINQIGDILADSLLLLPYYIKHIGFVSLGFYLQAKAIYKKHKEEIFKLDNITLSGHSLGGGNCCIIALLLLNDCYHGDINIDCRGGVKVLSETARNYLYLNTIKTNWEVNHKDPVPFLGWWKEPIHSTPRTGEERKHIFDWSLEAHMDYWG